MTTILLILLALALALYLAPRVVLASAAILAALVFYKEQPVSHAEQARMREAARCVVTGAPGSFTREIEDMLTAGCAKRTYAPQR